MAVNEDTFEKVLKLVGRMDRDQLKLVSEEVSRSWKREHALAARRTMEKLEVGSFVAIRDIKPKYLAGLTATVEEIFPNGNVRVRLTRGAFRRFTNGTVTFRNASCLEVL